MGDYCISSQLCINIEVISGGIDITKLNSFFKKLSWWEGNLTQWAIEWGQFNI